MIKQNIYSKEMYEFHPLKVKMCENLCLVWNKLFYN